MAIDRINRWSVFIGLILAVTLGSIGYMAADNQPPYEYDLEKSYIIPSLANDGDQITVLWKIKKINRICTGMTHRMLFDPKTDVILASYDPVPAALRSSTKDGYLRRTFMLPRGALPSGEIGYRATVCYECNAFQKLVRPLCITTPDLTFRLN